MYRFYCFVFLLATVLPARADDFSASNSLTRLDQLSASVHALEQNASNGSVRADCLTEHLIKIDSLTTLVRGLIDTRTDHLAAGNTAAAEGDLVMIQAACARAERAATEALDCQDAGQSKNHRASLTDGSVASAPASAPTTNRIVPTPVIPFGNEATCLKQLKFAALLVQVMDLETVTNTPMQALTQAAVEPLNGWHAEACVTLDSFCVVIARVLKLKVAEPTEPASYVQAVRDSGLPLEPLLHHRILFESEVRLFLSQGYAAPLASSRRLQPD